MRRFFRVGKTHGISNSFLLWIVVYILIGDFDSIFSRYSSRQIAAQVPAGYKTKYWIYTPEQYSSRTAEAFPLLISLHGGSAIGDNLNMLFERTHENPAQLIHINNWHDLPFIVVSPQLRRDPKVPHYNEQVWPPELVDEVVRDVTMKYNVDTTRIYITGISSGGAGAWDYAIAYPDKVAALLPMGGQAPRTKACAVKDIPVWAFHGENDVFVRTRFTTDAVKAINECSPSGQYRPHATVCKSMEHEVWDQIFNRKGGYDVFHWLLSFRKGDRSNKAPFVFTGVDRKMKVQTEPFYLTAEFFDSDGEVKKVEWTQVENGAALLVLDDVDSNFLQVRGASEPGTYIFRLSVTDDDGAVSSDEVAFTLVEEDDSPAVLSLTLTNQTGTTTYGKLENDVVYDLNEIGNKLNILAETDGFNVRIRWSVNSDQRTREANRFHLRFWKDYGPLYIREIDAGAVKSGWTVTPGEYLICATAFRNGFSIDPEGTSVCYKITFTDGGKPSRREPGLYVNNLTFRQHSQWVKLR